MGPARHVSRFRSASSIFDHSDSNPGKLYVIFKCFRDTDTTAKSVSPNSSSKNLNSTKYANCGKPNCKDSKSWIKIRGIIKTLRRLPESFVKIRDNSNLKRAQQRCPGAPFCSVVNLRYRRPPLCSFNQNMNFEYNIDLVWS